MKYGDEYGTSLHRTSSGNKKARLFCIFTGITAVTALIIWGTLPKKESNTSVPAAGETQQNLPADGGTGASDVKNKTAAGSGGMSAGDDVQPADAQTGQGGVEHKKSAAGDSETRKLSKTTAPVKGVPGPGDLLPEEDKPLIPDEKNNAAAAEFDDLKRLFQEKKYQQTAEKAEKMLTALTDGSQVYRKVLELLGNANWQRFISRNAHGGFAVWHKVSSGEYLGMIARKHRTTVSAVMKANKLKNSNILIGQRLYLLSGNWKITVSKQKRLLTLIRNGRVFMGFDIGIGRFGKTPTADFVIASRLKNPVYRTSDGRIFKHGEKGNELGDYFLKLAPGGRPGRPLLGYGIHGTPDENSVTRSLSNGCIRMRNADVERLYYIVPVGTPVEIRE